MTVTLTYVCYAIPVYFTSVPPRGKKDSKEGKEDGTGVRNNLFKPVSTHAGLNLLGSEEG